jgi:hypothetical protein
VAVDAKALPVSLAGWLPVGILAVVMVVLFVVGSLVTR